MTFLLARESGARRLFLAALTLGGFFLLGYGGILIGGAHSQASAVWPATAFGLCLLLRLSRSRGDDAAMLGAILAAGLMANWAGGATLALTLGFSIINLLGVLTGLLVMRRMARPRLNSTRSTLRFILAAGIGPSLVGAICSYLLMRLLGGDALASGVQWFIANLLGSCIVLPFGMTVSLRRFAKLKLRRRFLEATAVFSVLCAMALLGFRQSAYPLQFLVLASALIATARFRLMGAGTAIIIISAVALASPRPFDNESPMARLELLQLFLAVTSLICVRAAIVLNERDFQQVVIERRRRAAARAARFKSQLLAHVNQEAKAPLSAIIGFSGMIESGSLPPERAHEFAHVIAHNGEMLQRLHDDLFDMSRADSGSLALSACRCRPPCKAASAG